ncbi:PQQ-binding-like beta-propeller repeat protein [Jannaschia sp. W003]|uniref:outer membrane protein assembly factor BamB family protein n=1 Tax=Jannaschia sp. W003 TaxID=2867012 RepID=UPI0021A795E8|nr:PQQ-binding-like beta-propeller repeat protein [Jannaschia sp. W003]UWQ20231.1 PQQ-binding-like beta-propeller repeat protein [Jannaschia sp. W003]
MRAGAAAALILAAGACAEREPILPGAREAVVPEAGLAVLAVAASDTEGAAPLALPAPQRLAAWPLRVFDARNDPPHASLAAAPALRWSAAVGEGDSRRQIITADPVSDGGRLFAMDARARVTAVSTGGAAIWSRDLVPGWDRASDASGGGLAVVGGTLYASTGFGELHALDAATGRTRWVQRLDAPITTPKPVGGTVFVTSRDSRAWAIDAGDGRVRWETQGIPAGSVTTAAPAPALDGRLAVFPFGSGQLVAALQDSGLRLWDSAVIGQRSGVAYGDIGDITGDPVIRGGRVFAGTTAGRTVALDLGTGERLWTALEGAVSPLAAVGGALFQVTDRGQLIRLDAATGDVTWRADLPFYKDARAAKREGIFAHYGPVLAGGRLWVASSDGALRGFDPVSGALRTALPVPGGAASRPIAFGDALYVVGREGQLHAFR